MKPSLLFTMLLAGVPVWAQVARPTADEAKISVYDVPGGGAFRSDGLSSEPGLTDARDFTGTWNTQAGNTLQRFMALREAQARSTNSSAGPAPDATSGSTAGMSAGPPPGDAPPDTPVAGAALLNLRAQQSAKLACIPSGGVASGGDGPVEIIQTADQLTWMAEEMHNIRRIFLKGSFTPNLAPSFYGEAIGHFEGNTLVVETRGMKSLAPGVRMMERISKSDEGRVLHNQVSYVDANGKTTGAAREITLYYRPNEKMMEWICEDNGQVYQPGVYGRDL
ncbi:MAG: hypothetical protein QM808_02135 [Steroidobacteraceae bacterium]